ncbi:MAG: hypothetical protein CL878_07005 [Dehalococcoidia bacterium]|nr:hypothetical protein [Dehalococcoidia bacterium]
MARGRKTLAMILGGLLLLTACEAPTVFTPLPPTPTPLKRTRVQETRPTTEVSRGTLIEAITGLGRITAERESQLFFKNDGRLRNVTAKSGQMVKEGELLAELETGDLQLRIAKARVNFEQVEIRLQALLARAPQLDTRVEQEAVHQAELGVKQTELALEQLSVGPSPSAVKSAEAAVVSARAAVDRARSDIQGKKADLAAQEADLAAALEPPSALAVTNARAALESAQLRLAKLQQGPSEEDIRAAQISVDRARTQLAQLRDAPQVSPQDLENARLDVEKAKINYDGALLDATGTAQSEAAIRSAHIALERVQNTYTKLQSLAPSPWAVRQAEQAVEAAELGLKKVQTLDQFDLQQAELGIRKAQAQLDAILAPPTEQDLAPLRNQIRTLQLSIESAEAAIPSAIANLASAQAKLDDLFVGPSELAIKDQERRIELAQISLQQAQDKITAREASHARALENHEFDVQALQKSLQQTRLDLEQLEGRDFESKLTAPFDGLITRVDIFPGDTIAAYRPVIFISDPTKLIISADIGEGDRQRLAVGQPVEVRMQDLFPDQVMMGRISLIPGQVRTQTGLIPDTSTKIDLTWPGPGVEIGMLSRIKIILQQKDDVLIVPQSAVRSVGKRQFVEYMDEINGQPVKRSRNVVPGLSSGGQTEIIEGVDAGMVILAGS